MRPTRAPLQVDALHAPPVESAFAKASAWQASEIENQKSKIENGMAVREGFEPSVPF
jgi:hypothetical protein